MRMQRLISVWIVFCALFFASSFATYADDFSANPIVDRVQLVTEQIRLVKNRLMQGQHELSALQIEQDDHSRIASEKVSKNLLDKLGLDITVAKSNLDSIAIELSDSQQMSGWLEKNIQEIENQLNILNIFGMKIASNEIANVTELRSDLQYQQTLMQLEKQRTKYLQDLQSAYKSILAFKKDQYVSLNKLLKSRNLLFLKQQKMRDELSFQEQQNKWLQKVNALNLQLAKTDPVKSRTQYTQFERSIFYANENANLSYLQSLLVRYNDQVQQMKVAVVRGNSIGILNEISNQIQLLTKQTERLDQSVKSRVSVLNKHISYLTPKKNKDELLAGYIFQLESLKSNYQTASLSLAGLNKNIVNLRGVLDQALQMELASRQGLPGFGVKSFLELGKEILLVPTLTFQLFKSLSANLLKGIEATSMPMWTLFAVAELLILFVYSFLYKIIVLVLERPLARRDRMNAKWLFLQWLRRNSLDILLIANLIWVFSFFDVSIVTYSFVIYLALVWVAFKSLITVSRICLVETTHDTSGHDMRLYHRLKWMIFIGGVIIAVTVLAHQLPLIYEIKALCDWLFLALTMVASIFLLWSWHVIPNLILLQMETKHPYFQNSIKLFCILIPLLMLANSLIGLIGYVNLIMTVSWYESVFITVLIGYLILKGFLTDGMMLLSNLVIRHVNNGWLLTEALLKPLDWILRIALFLTSWAVLFLLYGWDKQSPIVERITRLLHYNLAHVLNTTITPINMIELFVVISVFYWTAKWTREFVYRMLSSRTKDMGIRNSIAILSQYGVVIVGIFICLRVLGIDFRALAVVAGMFAFGIGLGLRDLANNFACGFLILLERPLRVGDIVGINGFEGEVIAIGGRAVTVRTWDHMELMVPNVEVFNKAFTNWTAKDNIVRSVIHIQISRFDNPHEVRTIIQNVLAAHPDVLKDPVAEVFLKEMNDAKMEFELRYYVNIRHVKSRTSVVSSVLMMIWQEFSHHGIKPPYPQHEIFLRSDAPHSQLEARLVEHTETITN